MTISCSFLGGALMQTEYLRHVIEREVVLHMVYHVFQLLEKDWRQVRSLLLLIDLPRVEILHVLLIYLLHRQIIQFRRILRLVMPRSNALREQA